MSALRRSMARFCFSCQWRIVHLNSTSRLVKSVRYETKMDWFHFQILSFNYSQICRNSIATFYFYEIANDQWFGCYFQKFATSPNFCDLNKKYKSDFAKKTASLLSIDLRNHIFERIHDGLTFCFLAIWKTSSYNNDGGQYDTKP